MALFGVTFLAMGIIAIQSFSKHRDLLKQVVEKERKARIKKARQQQQETPSVNEK